MNITLEDIEDNNDEDVEVLGDATLPPEEADIISIFL